MIYKIKQKLFSLTQDFAITNQNDEEVFFVKGKFFSLGHKLHIGDKNGNDLLYIEQKVFRLLPEYYIFDNNNKEIARVKKKFTFFKPSYQIDSVYGSYELEGNVLQHNYEIFKNREICAEISKKWFSITDTYGVDVLNNENPEFIIALVIVIDMVMDDEAARNNG